MAKHSDILEAFREKLSEHLIDFDQHCDSSSNMENGLNSSHSSASSINTLELLSDRTSTFAQLADIFARDEEARALTMVILLKMCDISTEIRPTPVSQPWLNCLVTELAAQVGFISIHPAFFPFWIRALLFRFIVQCLNTVDCK